MSRYLIQCCYGLLCCVLATASAGAAEKPAQKTDNAPKEISLSGVGLSLHKQTYLIPLTVSSLGSSQEHHELKFQFSFKQRLFGWPVYFGYTQKAFWQILDEENSRPFRETNHNPELYWRFAGKDDGMKWGVDVGYEHESNGQSVLLSRSWDRLYIRPYVNGSRFSAQFKTWYRLPEDPKEAPDDPKGDDNPDIHKFYGYTEALLRYEWPNQHLISLMARGNPATGKGGFELNWSFPAPSDNFYLFVHAYSGYGESLIDYDNHVNRFGIGVMLKR